MEENMEEKKEVTVDLITTVQPGTLISNLLEIKKGVQAQMVQFTDIEATEDNLTDVKKDLARLRKLKAAMKDNKAGVELRYNMPLTTFQTLFDEVFEIITKAEDTLDSQVKTVSKIVLDKLLNERKDLFSEYIGKESPEVQKYLSACKEWLIPSEWKKKSVTKKAIVEYIETTIASVKTAYVAFKDHRYSEELLKEYALTGDFNATYSIMQFKDEAYQKVLDMQAEEDAKKAEIEEEQREKKEQIALQKKVAAAAQAAVQAARDSELSRTKMPTEAEIQEKQRIAYETVKRQQILDHASEQEADKQARIEACRELDRERAKFGLSPSVTPSNRTSVRQEPMLTTPVSDQVAANMEIDKSRLIELPVLTIPTDTKSLTVCVLGIDFEGERWKIQAILNVAKLIGLDRKKKEN